MDRFSEDARATLELLSGEYGTLRSKGYPHNAALSCLYSDYLDLHGGTIEQAKAFLDPELRMMGIL
jgi:hypothetical protein